MSQRRNITIAVVAVILAAGCFLAWKLCPWEQWFSSNSDIRLLPSAAEIVSVMPRGELYVATAIIEDYTTDEDTEYIFDIFPKQHSCALVMQQKVSYVIDMDSVSYEPVDDHTVIVRLPELRYMASTQNVRFLSDDATFWSEHMPSTSNMKADVESQIRSRFDTIEHRRQAALYAREAISHILSQIGYDADFRSVDTSPAGR